MKKLFVFVITIIFLFSAQSLFAQKNWTVELRGGVDFATKDLGVVDLKNGFGFEGSIDYKFVPYLGAYAGWSWNQFSSDEDYKGDETDFEETGYMFGLSLDFPIGEESPIAIFARGGGVFNHIETENTDGEIIDDSGHGIGWQASAGMDVSLGSGWQLRPGVKYQSLSRDLDMEDVTTEVDLNYFSVSVGIAKKF